MTIRPRGRGRPRKDWTISPPDSHKESSRESLRLQATGLEHGVISPSRGADELNLDDTELLLHFVQSTAQSIAGDESSDSKIALFWTTNVPRMGLSYPFVLHLMYALAAHHIAVASSHGERKEHYKRLAGKHLSRGTAALASATGNLDDSNCGAAYVGATLVCYCTFAAGPSAPEDLMVCYLGDEKSTRWTNLISGLRFIREAFAPNVLFAGLMSPLGPPDHSPGNAAKRTPLAPLCQNLRLAPVQWQTALTDLRRFVTRQDGNHVPVCLRAVDELATLFEGVYGDEAGQCNVSEDYQFVMGWVYRLDTKFTWAVRSGDAAALAILAHFAVLLKTMEMEWWLQGWAEHLCVAIRDMAGDDLGPLMDWPMHNILLKS